MVYNWKNNITGVAHPENSDAVFATLTAIDGPVDAFSYSLSKDYQGRYFEIDSHGRLSLKKGLDYESRALDNINPDRHFSVLVNAHSEDGTGKLQRLFVLTLQDENESNTGWVGNIRSGRALAENNSENQGLVAFYATDGDGVDVTYSLSGDDAAYFTMTPYNGGGGLYLKSILDYEDGSHEKQYSVMVVANSVDGSAAISRLYILSVDNVNELNFNDSLTEWQVGYSSSGQERYENTSGQIAIFSARDNDGGAISYWLSNDDANLFSLAEGGKLYMTQSFDYEAPPIDGQYRYSVVVNAIGVDGGVMVEDGAEVLTQLFVLTVRDVNEATEWQAGGNPSGATLPENLKKGVGGAISLADFGAIDGDGGLVTYSLSNARQGGFFEIDNNGVVWTKAGKKFEELNHYTALVRATATDGSESIQEIFILTVGNVDDRATSWVGIQSTGGALAENNPENIGSVFFNATDGDGVDVTYSLSGTDEAYFGIDESSGGLYARSSFDFESSHGIFYSVIVNADSVDGSATISQLFILTVTDQIFEWKADAGNLTGNVISENIAIGTSVADFGAIDADGGNVIYGLSGYGQGRYFEIDGNGVLRTKAGLDFESFNHYTVLVLSQDDVGDRIQQTFILTIGNIDEFATGWVGSQSTGTKLAENNPENIGSMFFNATDGDGVDVTYSLSGTDEAYFGIDESSGGLYARSSFDFESSHGIFYSVIVNADSVDGSAGVSQTFVLTVVNVNEDDINDEATEWRRHPNGLKFDENQDGYVTGFSARDDDGPGISYWLSGGDIAFFSIDASGGLYAKTSFDYEADIESREHRYSVVVSALGNAGNGGGEFGEGALSIAQHFVLTVKDKKEATVWQSDGNPTGNIISENIAIGTSVADFGATDGDGATVSYSVLHYPNAEYFNIDSNGVLTTKSVLDFEDGNAGHYSVLVLAQSIDGGPRIQQVFVLTIGNIDDHATGWVGSQSTGVRLAENNPENIGSMFFNATDGDGVDVTYSLSGTDAAYFGIDESSGGLYARSSFDFESSHGIFYSVIINADSVDGSAGVSQTFILTVENVNEFGTGWENNGNPTGNVVSENIAVGTSVADFGATDGDGMTVIYGLSGYGQGRYFEIDANGVLRTKAGLDFESSDHYTVLVLSQDDVSDRIQEIFILTVGNVDEFATGWVGIQSTGGGLAENNPENIGPVFFNATDSDAVSISYFLSGVDANYFTIAPYNGGGGLYARSSFDFEDITHAGGIYYSVTVNATSGEGAAAITQNYVLTVTDQVFEWQTNPTGNADALSENIAVGTSVADFGAIDPDGATVNYWILQWPNAQYFEIDSNGVLTTKSVLDFEDGNAGHYTVLVRAQSDEGGPLIQQFFVLTVGNENEFATGWVGNQSTGGALAENNPENIGSVFFNATDGDAVSISYFLSGSDAVYFGIAPYNGSGGLYARSSFDFESSHGILYSVVVNANSADDSAGVSQLFILSVVDVDESAQWQTNVSGNTEAETISIGTWLADFIAIDPEGATITYGLSNDYQGRYFAIDEGGILTTKQEFDFEDRQRYSVLVRAQATDEEGLGGRLQEIFILTITDSNEAATWVEQSQPLDKKIYNPDGEQTITMVEAIEGSDSNAVVGREVAKFKAVDDDAINDDTVYVTYHLTGDDLNYFTIDSNGRLFLASSLDFEDSNHGKIYSVVVNATSTDNSDGVSNLFVLSLTDRNDPASWQAGGDPAEGAFILDNVFAGVPVATFNAIDADGAGAVTYGISGDYDGKYFEINTVTGILSAKSDLDFESSRTHYTVLVRSQDDSDSSDGRLAQEFFILTLIDEKITIWETNGNPNGATLAENNLVGLSLADFGTINSHGELITYSLSGGDEAYFNIDADSGLLTAKSIFDYENQTHYSVVVVATSAEDSPAISQVFVLTVSDVSEPLAWDVDGNPSGRTLDENSSSKLVIGEFYAIDPDGEDISYSLQAGGDSHYFKIDDNGELSLPLALDFEDPNHGTLYSLVVIASNDSDIPISQLYVLTLANQNDNDITWVKNPSVYGNNGIILENNNPNQVLTVFSAYDGDVGAAISYSLDATATDSKYFSLNADSGKLSVISVFDHEDSNHDNSYHIRILAHSTDGSVSLSHDFRLTVGNENEFSTGWQGVGHPSGKTIAENNTAGLSLANFYAIDGDGVLVTYALAGTDSKYFNIDSAGILSAASSLDYESKTYYSVAVNANSVDESYPVGRLFILTVTDIDNTNDWSGNPSDGEAINENNTTAYNLVNFNNDGALPSGVNITYGLSGDAADYFHINSGSGLFSLSSSLDYESEHGQSINNRYSVIVTANATEEGNAISRVYILTVNDIDNTNDWSSNPTGRAIDENTSVGDSGLLSVADFNNNGALPSGVNITYGLSGDAADYFGLGTANGLLFLKSEFDYESEYGQSINNRYSVIITANATEEGTAISRVYILTVNDAGLATPDWTNNPPTGGLVTEDNNHAQALANFNNNGPLSAGIDVTYGLSGDNASFFQIDNSSGLFKTDYIFDYESEYGQSINNRYSVIITANRTDEGVEISRVYVLSINNLNGLGLEPDSIFDQPVGFNGKILFDPAIDNIGGINDGIDNEGLVIFGDGLVAIKYDSDGVENITYSLNDADNFENSFVGYTDENGNIQNHWFFVRDDATDNTGHIVFDADGVDVNLNALNNGGTAMTDDQINLLAGMNFETDGDFAKPDDLDLNLNNNAASLTHDQFLSLIGGSGNIDFV